MTRKNYFLAALFSVLFGTLSFGQCCTFTLYMYDSYGDGWNGGGNIDIYVNGTLTLNNQAATGSGSQATFTACSGDILTYNYQAGSFENENSFAIKDELGNIISQGGAPITPGLQPAGTAVCPETCSDGIQNQDETGVDCGGTFCIPCHCTNGVMDAGLGEIAVDYGGPCGDCTDGIQNGPETGVDCGGPFCIPCNTNGSLMPATQCCSPTPLGSVYPTNCDQIGTSAYNMNSPVIETTSQNASGCLPSPSPTGCGSVTGTGSWTHLTLENGVTYLQSSWAQGANDGIANGNSTTYSALYQGTSCGALSFVDCQQIVDFSASGYFVYQASWSGLDPNQDVWIYTWNSNNKNFNLDLQYIGVATPPSNTSCPGSPALGNACNLGATGATFNTPGSQAVSCSGGNWGSNENTTFYSFTADQTTGSLEIQNIICNDGVSGNAQFGVWTSCAAIGTYGSGFLGCAVGTASITLSPLVPGQTYYIAADGFAGDNCAWEFTGTGIILPIELAELNAFYDGKNIVIEWATASEHNNSYFTVQKTYDGRAFEDIGQIAGAGNSQTLQQYSLIDPYPYRGTSYYRIKQTDFDGKFEYSNVVSVTIDDSKASIVRTINLMGQEVDYQYKGVVIDIYSDGTSSKRIQ